MITLEWWQLLTLAVVLVCLTLTIMAALASSSRLDDQIEAYLRDHDAGEAAGNAKVQE